MNRGRSHFRVFWLCIWLSLSLATPGFSGDPPVEPWKAWLSKKEFTSLANELSKNVDLFRAVWSVDPNAEFYGGTSRDFLWFLRGELSKAQTRDQMVKRIDDLKHRSIQVSEFVVGQSDVDVVTKQSLLNVPFDRTFLTRLEPISPDWFQVGSARWSQELKQGYVPVEKIRLGKDGVRTFEGQPFGDGVAEIYDATPTFHFDPRITETEFFKEKGNHPLLLVLRYIRQVAVTYYRLYGTKLPDKEKLRDLIRAKDREQVEAVLGALRAKPEELGPFIETPQFVRRLDRALGKAFRSYTNPTAAKLLFDEFGIDRVLEPYGKRIAPYHTLLYQKYRNPSDVAKQIQQLNSTDRDIVTTLSSYLTHEGVKFEAQKPISFFHGTRSMEAYRNIVLQGNIASTSGLAGPGVYATDIRSKQFAKDWGGNQYLVELKLDPNAKIVDITNGPGKEAWEKFNKDFYQLTYYFDGNIYVPSETEAHSRFADFVGADLVRYPYGNTFAYCIKNGSAIQGQEGITIPILTLPDIKKQIESEANLNERFAKFWQFVSFDESLWNHWPYLLKSFRNQHPTNDIVPTAREPMRGDIPKMLTDSAWSDYPDAFRRVVAEQMKAKDSFEREEKVSERLVALIPVILTDHAKTAGVDLAFFLSNVKNAESLRSVYQALVNKLTGRALTEAEDEAVIKRILEIIKTRESSRSSEKWMVELYLEKTKEALAPALRKVMDGLIRSHDGAGLELFIDRSSELDPATQSELLRGFFLATGRDVRAIVFPQSESRAQRMVRFKKALEMVQRTGDLTSYEKEFKEVYGLSVPRNNGGSPIFQIWQTLEDPLLSDFVSKLDFKKFCELLHDLKRDQDFGDQGTLLALKIAERYGVAEKAVGFYGIYSFLNPAAAGNSGRAIDLTEEFYAYLQTSKLSPSERAAIDKILADYLLEIITPSKFEKRNHEMQIDSAMKHRVQPFLRIKRASGLLSDAGRKYFRDRMTEEMRAAVAANTRNLLKPIHALIMSPDRDYVLDIGISALRAGISDPFLTEILKIQVFSETLYDWAREKPTRGRLMMEIMERLGLRWSNIERYTQLRAIELNHEQQRKSDRAEPMKPVHAGPNFFEKCGLALRRLIFRRQ